MPHEKRFQAQFLSCAPAVLVANRCGNFARGKTFDHSWQRSENFAVNANQPRPNAWPANAIKSSNARYTSRTTGLLRSMNIEGMALQESDNRVDQVGKRRRELRT